MHPIENFDPDKLLEHVLPRIRTALEGWQRGMAADEPSLMNQITAQFSTNRNRSCDIGKNGKLTVESRIYELHRKGDRSTDKFGSDLAVTVSTDGAHKTCFIQFKCSQTDSVKLVKAQLDDASVQHVEGRACVLCVNRERESIRIKLIEDLLKVFPAGQSTATFHTEEWMSFHKWLISWIACEVGLPSDVGSGQNIEKMLTSFFINTIENSVGMWNFPEDYSPSKAWLHISAHNKKRIHS
jgi:hypothetical protein